MSKEVTIYELAGQWPGETEPSAWVNAMTADDLPHNGWYNQGAELEIAQQLQVSEGDPRLDSARQNSRTVAQGARPYGVCRVAFASS